MNRIIRCKWKGKEIKESKFQSYCMRRCIEGRDFTVSYPVDPGRVLWRKHDRQES
jgi:hypothetical protein